jgi:histidine ammonia-lyase
VTDDLVVIGESPLTLHDVIDVARGRRPARLAPGARERMTRSRDTALAIARRGDAVYGMTRGVGVRKRVVVDPFADPAYERSLVLDHRSGQGPPVDTEVVRATMLCLANNLARGYAGVRPELVERIVARLDGDDLPPIRLYGAIGQGDVVPLADLAFGLFPDEELEVKEGLSLVNSNAFSTALSCLALDEADRLLRVLVLAAALDLEAFRANLSTLDAAVPASRPYPGLAWAVDGLRTALDGSALWVAGAARNLQDPLSFRNAGPILGSARDLLAFALAQLAIELSSSQENPLILADEQRTLAVPNYELLPLAAALDVARIGFAPLLSTQLERLLKLLQAPFTGLTDGLGPPDDPRHSGLSEVTWTAQAIATEARLLADPVSVVTASSTQAEGIEDRITMAPLGARRLREMVALGDRLAALALVVACQAIELRGASAPLGLFARDVFAAVRECVAFVDAGRRLPDTIEPLVSSIRDGAITRLAVSITKP